MDNLTILFKFFAQENPQTFAEKFRRSPRRKSALYLFVPEWLAFVISAATIFTRKQTEVYYYLRDATIVMI